MQLYTVHTAPIYIFIQYIHTPRSSGRSGQSKLQAMILFSLRFNPASWNTSLAGNALIFCLSPLQLHQPSLKRTQVFQCFVRLTSHFRACRSTYIQTWKQQTAPAGARR